MTDHPKLKDKIKDFDLSKLRRLNFGKLEGEKDPILQDCFFTTYSIDKFINDPANYVLSPKGAGKSALFVTLKKRHLNKTVFDYSKYSIISINEAFGFDDEYLDIKKFNEKSRMKLTISWGLFILSKLIDDIKTNFKDSQYYDTFISKISQIDGFKEKFNLYGLNDLLESLSASINFTANGQEFEVRPTVKYNKRKQKLILNDLFKLIDEFYKNNNKTALVLIDRIDNFVQKEKYSLQKKYIQGLFDSIEEISHLENIHPTLFLRSDLFYSYDSDIELDKINDRTVELKWSKGETLNFILYRFNNNEYISNSFTPFLHHLMLNDKPKNDKPKKLSFIKRKIKHFFGNLNNDTELKDKKAYNYRISEKYLTMFFPKEIELNNGDSMKFVDWLFEYLKDANGFLNPRLLIDFFNQLIEFENLYLEQYCDEIDDSLDFVKPSFDENNNLFYKNLFHQESFASTYSKIQNDSLKNILTLVKTKDYQILFKEINAVSYHKNFFRYGDINLNKYDMSKDTYTSLLKYLRLLGYCKETDKQKYMIPKLYQKRIELI
jgi:hypothetical protein